jgi:hypothetical protein
MIFEKYLKKKFAKRCSCTKRSLTMSVLTVAPISVKEFAGMMQLIGPVSRWSKTLGTCRPVNRVENAKTSK